MRTWIVHSVTGLHQQIDAWSEDLALESFAKEYGLTVPNLMRWNGYTVTERAAPPAEEPVKFVEVRQSDLIQMLQAFGTDGIFWDVVVRLRDAAKL